LTDEVINKILNNYKLILEFEGKVRSKVFNRPYKILYKAKALISDDEKVLIIDFNPDGKQFYIFYSISDKNEFITTNKGQEGEFIEKNLRITILNKEISSEEIYNTHQNIIKEINLQIIKNPIKIARKLPQIVMNSAQKMKDTKLGN